jgi:hypothetical protein
MPDTPRPNPFLRLFRSSKFLTALLGVAQSVAGHYLDIPFEVWGSVNVLLLAVIAGITGEDMAEKKAAGNVAAAVAGGGQGNQGVTIATGGPTTVQEAAPAAPPSEQAGPFPEVGL